MLKIRFKNAKMVYIFAQDPRGCDVALRATWQRHGGPRGTYAVLYIFTIII